MATLATLVVNLTANAQGFISEMDKAESRTGKILGGIGKNVQTLGKAAIGGVGVVAGAVTGAGAALAKLAIDAAPIESVQDAFDGLAESAGRGGDEMLAALEQGSTGMIAQRDLMMSFNKAAQLVSTDFATQLPDAMQYLGKVAASTGQDMGFMLDSLVVGVGRLSGPILDNLGIQVQLSEATARAAEMFGVQEDALTKTQQQAGMMAVVMEKLQANTAAMPDVAGSAAAGIAQMQATFQNFKDQAGMAMLPILSKVTGKFLELANRALPAIMPVLQTVANLVEGLIDVLLLGEEPLGDWSYWREKLTEGFGEFGNVIIDGIVPALQSFLALAEGLINVLILGEEPLGDWSYWREKLTEGFGEFGNVIVDLVGTASELISKFISGKDVLIALGIAIASVVIPAVISLVSSIAPVIAVGLALIGVVALIRNAWESNFLGIRDAVAIVQAKIQELWSRAQEFWESFWSGFKPALDQMYARLQEFWTQIQPALLRAWNALQDLWNTVVGMWKQHLQPALDKLTDALGLGGDKTGDFGQKVGALAGLLLQIGLEGILNAIVVAVKAFAAAVEAVASAMQMWSDLIGTVKSGLDGLSLPTWLTPGSPTPLEIGIRGISNAMQDLNLAGGMSFAAGSGGGGGMIILAPIFLDPREVVMAGGDIDYSAVAQRLKEINRGM